jgi:hypothetical protein
MVSTPMPASISGRIQAGCGKRRRAAAEQDQLGALQRRAQVLAVQILEARAGPGAALAACAAARCA